MAAGNGNGNKDKRVLVLGDYENLALNQDFNKIDWKKLISLILEIGKIDFAFMFAPPYCLNTLPEEINDWGFEAIMCQKRHKDKNSEKLEDTVDIHIIRFGMKFLHHKEITDIVILGNDVHMVELIKEARLKKVDVHVWGLNEISSALIRIVPDAKKVPLKK